MRFSDFLFFCIITMGSARSQKIFFDKQSETCQRISSSKKYTDMRRKVDFSKHSILIEFHTYIRYLYTFYEIFRRLCFSYMHDGLCEISEKFLRQTIWDLSENFQLQEMYWYKEESWFLKTLNFKDNLFVFGDIMYTF